jgi:E3 ubiquitin-protein ligase UBR1
VLFIAISFSRFYPKMSEDFYNIDREPELNFIFFSVQLFTAPSLALLVVKEDDAVFKILSMLTSNFLRSKEDEGVLDLNVRFIVERRYFHGLNDLRYFLQSDGVKSILSRSRPLIAKFLEFLSIFQGMDAFSRALDVHVEFESESWVYAFNLSMQITFLINHFSNLFDDKESIMVALSETIALINRLDISMAYLENSKFIDYLNSGILESWDKDFEVGAGNQALSFHHPLHWFLGHLLKRASNIFQGDFSFLKNLVSGTAIDFKSFLLKIMEPGLRIKCLFAQTRSGYW